MLLMIQVKVNESIHAIIQTIRIYLSRALLIIRGGKKYQWIGIKNRSWQRRYSSSFRGASYFQGIESFLCHVLANMSLLSFIKWSNAFEKECNQWSPRLSFQRGCCRRQLEYRWEKNVTTKRNLFEDVVKQKNGRRKEAVAICEPARFIDNWLQRNLAVGSLALWLKRIPIIENNFNVGDVCNLYDFVEFQWSDLWFQYLCRGELNCKTQQVSTWLPCQASDDGAWPWIPLFQWRNMWRYLRLKLPSVPSDYFQR